LDSLFQEQTVNIYLDISSIAVIEAFLKMEDGKGDKPPHDTGIHWKIMSIIVKSLTFFYYSRNWPAKFSQGLEGLQ